MKKAFSIFVGFIHDFAAGCWAATVLAVYRLNGITDECLRHSVFELKKEFFIIGIVCAGIVLLGGIGRTFTYAYIGDVYGEDAEPMRKKMLFIKHVFLMLIFIMGIYWQYKLTYH